MYLFNKINFIIILLAVSQICFAQKKEILIVDGTTNIPIENVNIYYPENREATFTNSEGKASLNIQKMILKIAHIQYDEVTINGEVLNNIEKITLSPKSIQLDEVLVSSFNLKKAINYVLDNYKDLYVSKPFEKECNFKETMSIDNQLKRLILTKVNWWGKSYELKHFRDLKLRLGSIDFNKNEPMDVFYDSPEDNLPSKSGFIETKRLITVIYLNTLLKGFFNSSENLTNRVEKSPPNQIIISFETDWKVIDDYQIRSKGRIVFDKESRAIIAYLNKTENKNRITRNTSKTTKKKYSYENTNSTINLDFYKSIENKWTLNSCQVNADFNMIYNDKTHFGNIKSNIYVLKETDVKKVSNEGLMDLSKPICQNLPSNSIKNSNSILLSEEEKKFIGVDE
jgi:hypothetical protein